MSGDFLPGDSLLLIDERDREFLVTVPGPEDDNPRVKGQELRREALLELRDGQLLAVGRGRKYLVMRPSLEQVVMNMPRQAQVIYPKDLATILVWGDIGPGMTVAEVGCGHGALTMTLLRALGPEGSLTTYDIRQDHLNRTRKNAAHYLGEAVLDRWRPVLGDPGEVGFAEPPVQRLISDVPEPWLLMEAALEGLKPGGIWLAYLPTVLQMSRLHEAIQVHPGFCLPQAFETLQRFWHVRVPSVRPAHDMKAHTGFIVTCRRRWRPEVPEGQEEPDQESPAEMDDPATGPAEDLEPDQE